MMTAGCPGSKQTTAAGLLADAGLLARSEALATEPDSLRYPGVGWETTMSRTMSRLMNLASPHETAMPLHLSSPRPSCRRGSQRRLLFLVASLAVALLLSHATPTVAADSEPAPGYAIERDLLYRSGDDLSDAARERCRLDVYHPTDAPGYATVVWFHGGGLTSGERFIPEQLKQQGIAVVAANYRLAPAAASPIYIEDAAAAVAWTLQNIERFGGDPQRVIVSGHSAGGYLAAMVGLDKRWLAAHDIDADSLAGLAPYSGHAITHFTIRKERGILGTQPVVDDLAPLFHVRKDAPPILLVTGDRDMELLGRYEETAYLWRMLKEAGHERVELFELEGYNHGQMAEPAHPLLLRFIKGL